jgi:hypothetical protein
VGDVAAGRNTAGVDRAQGELGARLADGQGRNDADRRDDLHHPATAQVSAVALL